MTKDLRGHLDNARKNPAKELGLSEAELERRRKEATKPRSFFSDTTKRQFDVKSSTRAQQIMNQGINKAQRDKRQRELRGSMKVLRKFQVLLSVCGAMFIGWLAVEFLLPQYAAVQQRNRLMQLRYDRAQEKLRAYALEHPEAADRIQSTPPGVVFVSQNNPVANSIQ